MIKFVNDYVEHIKGIKKLHEREFGRRYHFSSLKYFKRELGLSQKKEPEEEDMLRDNVKNTIWNRITIARRRSYDVLTRNTGSVLRRMISSWSVRLAAEWDVDHPAAHYAVRWQRWDG